MSNVLRSSSCGCWCRSSHAGVLTAATAQTPLTQKPKIKSTYAVPIQSVDGADNFRAYCAVCHGADARHQLAAPAMKVKVPDLTTRAARPTASSMPCRSTKSSWDRGRRRVQPMVWRTCRSGATCSGARQAKTAMRVSNLVKYIQSIQAKCRACAPRRSSLITPGARAACRHRSTSERSDVGATQNRVGRNDRRDVAQRCASKTLSTHREATPLIIRESQTWAAQLGPQDAILFHHRGDCGSGARARQRS